MGWGGQTVTFHLFILKSLTSYFGTATLINVLEIISGTLISVAVPK